jgi:hypothetical protein
MPFVFLTKDGANIDGSYWDTETHGAPEWACDIVGFNEVPSTSLDDHLKRLAAIGIEEVLVVTVDQTTPLLQVWRREGTILKPQQPSTGRAFSELLQVWFVGQNDGTVRLAFGDDGEFLVPTWDEFSLEPSPYAESPVEHARAAARRRLR